MADEVWKDMAQNIKYDGEALYFARERHLDINRRAYALKLAEYLESAFKLENAGCAGKFLFGRMIKRLDDELKIIWRNGKELKWENYDTTAREGK